MGPMFLLVLLCPLVFCTDVISLVKETKSKLDECPLALVKYYAPWCGHCKSLAPNYEAAAAKLKELKVPVSLFEVDCVAEPDMCASAEVRGYPTLKAYAKGVHAGDYDGDRTTDSIVNFIKDLSTPPCSEITSMQEYNEMLDGGFTVILQSKNSEGLNEFEKVAQAYRRSFKFVHTQDSYLDPSVEPIIKLLLPKEWETPLESRFMKYDGLLKSADIKTWIENNAVGLAGIRDKAMQAFFKKPLLVVYARIDMKRDPSKIRYLRNRLIQVATNSSCRLQFALSDSLMYADELSDMGLTPEANDTVAVIMGDDDNVYKMDGNFCVTQLSKFVDDFAAGALKPYVKSDPIPEEEENTLVKKVVGLTFDEVVFDKSKDVLIEFYAPWCGHCKALASKYEKLAEKLSKEKNIVIASIDATSNSFPSKFKVSGYPTIYWVSKHSELTVYNGKREVDDMLKFVAKHATEELSGYNREGTPIRGEL